MSHLIPKHWLDALMTDTEYRKAENNANHAYVEYVDLREYAKRSYLEAARANPFTFQTVEMFGYKYHDAELGALVYLALKDYERLQLVALAEYKRVVKSC